jgi:hypothetical protein
MAKPDPNSSTEEARKERRIPAVSAVLGDGTILETVVDPEAKRTSFVLAKDGEWRSADSVPIDSSARFVPYSPRNNLLAHQVVLLPSEPEEYGSEEVLLREIESFIHRYVDVSPLFEKIACYYVLLTWIYDRFNELPYLRLRGEPGSGKTRFMLTVGSLCYKPIFASGASTVSPLFRILDSFRGTLVIDEGDFRLSDEQAEIVKILNNGNAKGFPVLRSEATANRGEFNPRAYEVYGPKLIATRGFFKDRALESRCLTEETGGRALRDDIPISLPQSFKDEAQHLRNQLLLYRFRNLKAGQQNEVLAADRTIEPRLNQIFLPLLAVVRDPQDREELRALARRYHGEMISERGMDLEAQVLECIRDLRESGRPLAIKDITSWLVDRQGDEYERKLTTKRIGNVIRRKLQLRPVRASSGYVIPPEELPKVDRLYERYGIPSVTGETEPTAAIPEPDFP